jgi:hypothetical protein
MDTRSVFRVDGSGITFTIDACYIYIATESTSLFDFVGDSAAKFIGCFFSADVPAILDDPKFAGSKDNSGNSQPHEFGHFPSAPCEIPDGEANLLCIRFACDSQRIRRDIGPCVTISGCFFQALHSDSGGAIESKPWRVLHTSLI